MMLEIAASRLVARFLGQSLYTWTSIIGVILAGISLGNFFGGVYVDKTRPKPLLEWSLLFASIASWSSLLLSELIHWEIFNDLGWLPRVLLTVTVLFFAPAFMMGFISPVAASLVIKNADERGRQLGWIFAMGAVGSIFGTFLAGFALIPWIGVSSLIYIVSLILGIMGFGVASKRWVHLIWILILIGLFVSHSRKIQTKTQRGNIFQSDHEYVYFGDSAYQAITIYDGFSEWDSRYIRYLELDKRRHGVVDLSNPPFLEFSYQRVCREVVRKSFLDAGPRSAFFLGGGSYSLPRWIQNRWPQTSILVAEVDPRILEVNHRFLALPKDTTIQTVIGDARLVLQELSTDHKFDLIVGDVFNDANVPFHLTTAEFNRCIADHLSENGCYVINIIENFKSARFLSSVYETMKTVFPHVQIFTSNEDGVGGRIWNYIVVASLSRRDFSAWELGHTDHFMPGSLLTPNDLNSLQQNFPGHILTDDYAPVEYLLLPAM